MDIASLGLGLNEYNRQKQWRKEDIAWRENEALVIGVEQKERMVDLKCRALKSIANLSALVAGFTIVMFIELSMRKMYTLASNTLCFHDSFGSQLCIMVQATLLLTCITLISMQHNDKKGSFSFGRTSAKGNGSSHSSFLHVGLSSFCCRLIECMRQILLYSKRL